MVSIEQLRRDLIEQSKQELISKIEQLQREYPQRAWLQEAVDMQKPTDLLVISNSKTYAALCRK